MVGGFAPGDASGDVVPGVTQGVLDAARAGDRSAWRHLVGRYAGLVHAVCRGHGLGGDDAVAVERVVWLRAAENLARFCDPAAVGPWIAAVARGECLRVLRAAGRIPPVPGAGVPDVAVPQPPQPAADAAVSGASEAPEAGGGGETSAPAPPPAAALLAALSRLDPASQRLLRLAAARPRPTAAEVGAALDLPVDAVGPALDRALARLGALAGAVGSREADG